MLLLGTAPQQHTVKILAKSNLVFCNRIVHSRKVSNNTTSAYRQNTNKVSNNTVSAYSQHSMSSAYTEIAKIRRRRKKMKKLEFRTIFLVINS